MSDVGRPEPATPGQPGRCQVWALVSLCLGYPDETLVAARSQLAGAACALAEGQARRHLTQFTDWFAAASEPTLTVQYVRTFDMRRDTSLNLTYHSHGETRRRGLALLELKRRLRSCGMVPEDGELPDHLPLLLEVAAVEPEHGADLLRLVRPGIEMLRRGLAGSPYGHLLDALAVTLGPVDTTTSAVVDELVVLGPPVEEVGAGLETAGPDTPEPGATGIGTTCAGPSSQPLPFPRLRPGRGDLESSDRGPQDLPPLACPPGGPPVGRSLGRPSGGSAPARSLGHDQPGPAVPAVRPRQGVPSVVLVPESAPGGTR